MRKQKLSQRLNQMAKWIEPDSSIADIGTDHGYLPYYLFEQGRIKNAILCDINSGPLENAKNTFHGSPYGNSSEFRLGSGIEPLKNGEVDYVIIAGMGGSLIKAILANNIEKTKSFKGFFLQPQTEQDVLRVWLLENHFQIVNDLYVFEDQKYYEALFVMPNALDLKLNPVLTISKSSQDSFYVYAISKDLEYGYKVHPESIVVYRAYLAYKRQKYEMIQSKIKNVDSLKYAQCQSKLQQIKLLSLHLEMHLKKRD
ncbi:class I SAM-dependent methyltransferase [Fusibacter sp. 3D3]|uniref:tRNA (adenine(22)-N(1))-methyltransferase n=1 Tax=Fusibacter sp. 3D3 TaxID=1048380 RepID=UPI0008533EB1|nr:class I SAM-dependent methyltransferase [Fusibacter sp. 3D3]GAU77484.1 putative tRNA-m1A22 methylase [Fusibacter sp. 3D3]